MAREYKIHLSAGMGSVTYCGYDATKDDTTKVGKVTCLRCVKIAAFAYNVPGAKKRYRALTEEGTWLIVRRRKTQ